MDHRDLALVQGLDHTRATLRRWNAAPRRVVGIWALGALLTACALLYLVWAVSHRATPDTGPLLLPGVNEPATAAAAAQVLGRNALVLALHAFACVAGYIAGSRLPGELDRHRGLSRRIHAIAGPAAIAFVGAATLFSLGTQAYVLGSDAATLAAPVLVLAAAIEVWVWPQLLRAASPLG